MNLLSHPSTLGCRAALCESLGVSKASLYRHLRSSRSQEDPDPDRQLRAQIERIVLETSNYGYRRIAAELSRSGIVVNRKRVLRVMREANLLCRRKKRRVRTTDSSHGLAVYPNLKPMIVLSRPNQLWVADITYIALPEGFVYLAAILDAYSRKAVGWAVSARIDTQLTLAALAMAISLRGAPLYHHSDRGVQYASAEYVAVLADHQVQISMSRTGNPYDNASMESFMKTLKHELVCLSEYTTIDEARADIDQFLEIVYNQKRLHSSLGYMPPEEFENNG